MITKKEVEKASYEIIGGKRFTFEEGALEEIQRIAKIMWSSMPKAWRVMEMGIKIGLSIAEVRNGHGKAS